MSAEPTSSILSALDQRLQVSRVLGLDPVRALASPGGDSQAPVARAPLQAPLPSPSKEAAAFASRWPVGSVVDARVTAQVEDDRIKADFDGLEVELNWRKAEGALPQPGQVLAFRVMAHVPQLVLQRAGLPVSAFDAFDEPSSDAPTHLSPEARSLQAATLDAAMGGRDGATVRFENPLIAQNLVAHASDVPLLHAADVPDTAQDAARLANALPDALAQAVAARLPPEVAANLPFVPVVLQGPAWRDQPMELMVRRHRRDERLDDPALDDWCGELVIDLPLLGRVAGHLSYSMQGLRVRLDADRDSGISALTDAAPELAAALADANLRLSNFTIGRPFDAASLNEVSMAERDAIDEIERAPLDVRMAAALSYRDGMRAPVVVAKGRGLVADEIVRLAREHDVAVQVSGNLATLLMNVEIDHTIPPQLFQAVAELLAWLYRLEGRAAPATAPA